MIQEEFKTVRVRTKVNYICPYCNRAVDPKEPGAQWVKNRGSVKRYFHEKCYREKVI